LYLFDNLTPGDYFVGFELPPGFAWTGQDQGDDALDSDVNPATGLTILTPLEPGETDLTWDAGLNSQTTSETPTFTPTPSDTPTATQTPSVTPTPTNTNTALPGPELVDPKTDSLLIDLDGDGLVDPGDTLRYTISITNIGGSNAVGVTFSDTPDPNTSLVVGTVFTTLGTVTEGNTAGDTSVAVDVGTLAPGASVTITFQVTIDNPLPAGVDQVANQGVVAGDNVPTSDTDDPSTDEDDDPTITSISQPAPTSTPGPNPNPTATSPLPIVDVLPFTGFAPDLISSLPPLTDSNRPLAMGDLWLEIPSQNVQMNIYGIPAVNGEYDVSWLGSNAGYLYGSAFPTWQGNTALTGHVYLADGTPGPFYNLRYLHWGDTVVLHAFGQRYTYEIRRTRYVRPDDLSVLGHEKLDWVTLITCSGYDERTNSYSWRLAAQAVLISVEPEASN
jgi:LPXTG-site transpeptidase (sortase) family protein